MANESVHPGSSIYALGGIGYLVTICLAGGERGEPVPGRKGCSASAHRFNLQGPMGTSTGRWETLPSLLEPRSDAAAASKGSVVYLLGTLDEWEMFMVSMPQYVPFRCSKTEKKKRQTDLANIPTK